MDKKEQAKKETICKETAADDYDYLGNSASCQDCTGLIPSALQSKAEQESYEALYHYQPKAVSPENNLQE